MAKVQVHNLLIAIREENLGVLCVLVLVCMCMCVCVVGVYGRWEIGFAHGIQGTNPSAMLDKAAQTNTVSAPGNT